MTKREDWFLLQSGPGNPAFNMAVDEALLESMPRLGKPVLRFYSWTEPAASFGYFQKYAEVERATLLRPLVRRPTGGGVVPHDADWTYSLAFPAEHEWYGVRATESYRRAHVWVQGAFSRLSIPTELAQTSRKTEAGQCFAGYEKFDLLWQGQKIAGAAQRRTRNGLLIQGSIQPPARGQLAKADWQKAMCDLAYFENGVVWREFNLDGDIVSRVEDLEAGKYSVESHTRKR
jgi:lipoyl(octanoyl) transferase